jgi:hypothetical protein
MRRIIITNSNTFIENDVESDSRQEISNLIYTKQFVKELSSTFDNRNLNILLPRNCRFYMKKRQREYILIEEPPQIRTITVTANFSLLLDKIDRDGDIEKYGITKSMIDRDVVRKYRFNLSFPYILYMLLLDNKNIYNTSLYYRLSPIVSSSDYLLQPNLLNVENNTCAICMGEMDLDKNLPISLYIDSIISSFWSTEFNMDILTSYNAYQNIPFVNNLFEWQYHTSKNPLFIYQVPWIKRDSLRATMTNIFTSYLRSSNEDIFNDSINMLHDIEYNKSVLLNTNSEMMEEKFYSHYYNNGVVHEELRSGDKVELDGKKFRIEYFNYDQFQVIINLLDEENNLVRLELTPTIAKKIIDLKGDENTYKQVALSNGKIVKVGDIVSIMEFGYPTYKEINKITKYAGGDGFQLYDTNGRMYYYTTDMTVVDISKIRFKGIQIVEGKNYCVLDNSSNTMYHGVASKIEISEFGKSLMFSISDKNRPYFLDIPNYRTDIDIIQEESSLEKGVWCIGPYLNYSNEILKYNGLIYISPYSIKDEEIIRGHIWKMIEDKKLRIITFGSDISFDIGNKVVIADWEKGIDFMTTIFEIEDFIIEDDIVYVVVKDKESSVFHIPYINLNNLQINISLIRKVSLLYENNRAGVCISPNTRVYGFTKKMVLRIVAFLIDTSMSPLVLLSDLSTITYENLKNFDIVNKEPTPVTMPSIEDQGIGSIAQYHNTVEVSKDRGFKSFEILIWDYKLGNTSGRRHMIGYPIPRVSISTSKSLKRTYLQPTYRGEFVKCNIGILLKIPEDRIINNGGNNV